MSVQVSIEASKILKEINNLYLNETFSDVEFIVDGERLPAHQVILGQRCPVIKAMFPSNIELQKPVIEVPETSLEAFKLFLKFVYTGNIEWHTVSSVTVYDTMTVANTYEMESLKEFCIDYLKTICAVDNVVGILNKAIEKSQEALIEYCIDYVCDHSVELIGHDSFNELPVKALHRVLEKPIPGVSGDSIFRAFVEWIKANPAESEHFPELLKKVDFNTLTINKIATAIQALHDGNDLLDVVREQMKAVEYPDKNVFLFPNVKVITGGIPSFFKTLGKYTLMHIVGNDSITIALARPYTLNYLKMKLAEGDKSYWVEVSEDMDNWTRVIDYSNYICRSYQQLYFKECAVRYIRICGAAPAKGTFEISELEACYKAKSSEIDAETGCVIPLHNVALAENNAVVIQGESSRGPNGMLNGSTSDGLTLHQINNINKPDSIVVQLPQPYILDSMNLHLHDYGIGVLYSYNIEVSTDKINWTRVFSEENATSWRHAKFDKQPVVFVKITGVLSTSKRFFVCDLLECPAMTTF